jgi:Ca-activated chloride channel family protein
LFAAVCGCSRAGSPSGASAPAEPLKLIIVYGSEKKSWFEEQARRFEASGARTPSGRAIRIDGRPMGSGEAVQAILDGTPLPSGATAVLRPHVYSPASAVYLTLLNQGWLSRAGNTRAIAPPGEPLVLSPIVIAIWKPMAQALGWPDKRLGWADLLRVGANPAGWGAFGFPEWGRFKLGHTHPEFSNSGLLAVLAEAYAGAKKTRGLTVEDVDSAATQAFVRLVEGAVVHYGSSTGFFAEKMLARGPSYLSAAVLYENLVIESYQKSAERPLVAIYPVEGTFWSDHPYSVLDGDWVDAEARAAAAAFLAFLKARPQQERALALGFRPADPAIAIGAPVDAAHGVDPKQPQTLLAIPDAAVLQKLIATWHREKKAADVVLVFDKSGSMDGRPLIEARQGARSFIESLHNEDIADLILFDDHVFHVAGPVNMGTGRAALLAHLDGVTAGGGTALYDAIGVAYNFALDRAREHPNRIHAVVVMTDGIDESSSQTLQQLRARFPTEGESPIKVFTIAYGEQANHAILGSIAEAAKGSSATGSVETIRQVYRDMASFF